MAVKCNVCYAWHPKDWNGWKWADTVAQCEVKGRFTCDSETCEDGKIVRPPIKFNRVNNVALKPSNSRPANVVAERKAPVITGELFLHQKDAFEKFKDATEIPLFMEPGTGKSATTLRIAGYKFKKGMIDALLVVAPNDVHCVAGDTEISYIREGGYRINTDIEHLFLTVHPELQAVYGRRGYKYDKRQIYIRALVADRFRYIRLHDVIFHGNQPCIKITTESGKSLKLTVDHKVLTPKGYVEAGTLSIEDAVICNGQYIERQRNINSLKRPDGSWKSDMAYTIEKIVAIEDVGMQEVFDLVCDEPHNFVANKIVVHNCQWAHEQIPLWLDCPYDIQCLFGRGGAKVAYPFDNDPDFLQVVCVNIDTFSTPAKWKDIVEWANTRKLFLVLDEATSIKNITSQRTQRMLYSFNDTVYRKKTIVSSTVKTAARAILTGTPVTNGPMDLWAMMEFLRPNFFRRNWYSFQAHFGMFTTISVNDRVVKVPLSRDWWEAIKDIQSYLEANAISGCSEDTFNVVHSQDHYEGPYKHADELKAILDPVAFYKRLEDCVDMPKQIRITRELRMSPAIEECYSTMVDELVATYEDHTMTAKSALTAMIRLQQISSGFLCDKTFGANEETEGDETDEKVIDDRIKRLYGLADDEDILPDEIKWIGNSNPKLEALYRDVDEASKPVIVLTRFTAEASRIYDDLKNKYSTCLMTGWKRVGSIEDFQAGKYDIMVANSAVVSRGFNLQNSHCILFYSNTFSLETRLQGEGRIYRIAQEHPCEYIDYCYTIDTGFTIDEKIVSALSLKRNLLDYLVGAPIRELVS